MGEKKCDKCLQGISQALGWDDCVIENLEGKVSLGSSFSGGR